MSPMDVKLHQHMLMFLFFTLFFSILSDSTPSSLDKNSASDTVSPTTGFHRKLGGWITGYMAGASGGLFIGFLISVLFMFALPLDFIKGRREDSGTTIYSLLIKKADLAFLEKNDGLATLEIIGRGGCGEVYKAELPRSNGKVIAIKKITQPPTDAAAEEDQKMCQIRSEINTIGQIRHRNLVPLLAHVPRPDCHYLIYEFMKNGSLHDLLNKVKMGERELNWLSRHKIALGVAAGLEYLHTCLSPSIIHRDIKPANILLNDEMEARIADFGLATVMPEAQTHMTASIIGGTRGYMAPEYYYRLEVTDKYDIYSFGIMLGVLVIGKLPSDDFFVHTEEIGLAKWIKKMMTSKNPMEAIDPKLMGNGYEEQMLCVLKIACFCTNDDPKQRPNSKEVRKMLSEICV